ncbi:hypothetical protein Nepgr_015388 [Nepenthes gracilis]|uniref:CG-1 domain-containing protein n=1 Tax=Nepenthes gracilis TaxID=150966 RepID=A0AAD3SN64_NEPGR|nr:hypothetical protein Nepgr_015388 [Nepenthes gracilis]
MTDRGSTNPGIRLDMQQIQLEAQHRWLRPAEICEILRNYQGFHISSEPPDRPPSGSLFLFDRKVLRFFRKDGHNWRKKKDGKTVKEAHEKLKVGSVDMLHCYYAHGEENENFQRRCYWLLEEDSMHIVFVHYLNVKGNKSSMREIEAVRSDSQISNSLSSSFSNQSEALPANAGSPSVTSTLTSAYEDVEHVSGFNYILHAHGGGSGDDVDQSRTLDLATWEEVFEQCTRGLESGSSHPLISTALPAILGITGEDNGDFIQLLDGDIVSNLGSEGPQVQSNLQENNKVELSSAENQDGPYVEDSSYAIKLPLLRSIQAVEGLQKVDSFSKWASKELEDVGELHLNSSSNISWCSIESSNIVDDSSVTPGLQLDNYTMSPSISQDQLFSIDDFSPNWTYTDSKTEVFIHGRFLKPLQEVAKCNWSCMFGEVEVPADVIENGVLCCYAPPLNVGRVSFYITCSNRLACSEVREFEYRPQPSCVDFGQNVDTANTCSSSMNETVLHMRLERLLSLRSSENAYSLSNDVSKQQTIAKIISLMENDECCDVLEVTSSDNRSSPGKILKAMLFYWLVDKVNDDGKGPNVLDNEGQGVLHLAAALGYDWIIQPTLEAGVSINFRDVNGWTALHWAAFCGREKTVALLVSLGAASGALTDPSPEFPLGRTPADLALSNGYKGISGFLAESSLTTHLASLAVNDRNMNGAVEDSITKAVLAISEKTATQGYEGDPSLKDSLAAVCNATQAASRIHQVYRMQSFQRKQIGKYAGNEPGLADERILSLISAKTHKHGPVDEQAHTAAVQIQKKYRGWKKRKEFLIIRQRVVKIQAHVRGHQVRKRYKAVVWSVGILEKVILRWRRKGTGLRGFRPDLQIKGTSTEGMPSEEDDYGYLKEGRRQTEERFQKALVRVKSMVQYPEARAQYSRLLAAVQDIRKKQTSLSIPSSSDCPVVGEEDIIDVEMLLDDDSFIL